MALSVLENSLECDLRRDIQGLLESHFRSYPLVMIYLGKNAFFKSLVVDRGIKYFMTSGWKQVDKKDRRLATHEIYRGKKTDIIWIRNLMKTRVEYFKAPGIQKDLVKLEDFIQSLPYREDEMFQDGEFLKIFLAKPNEPDHGICNWRSEEFAGKPSIHFPALLLKRESIYTTEEITHHEELAEKVFENNLILEKIFSNFVDFGAQFLRPDGITSEANEAITALVRRAGRNIPNLILPNKPSPDDYCEFTYLFPCSYGNIEKVGRFSHLSLPFLLNPTKLKMDWNTVPNYSELTPKTIQSIEQIEIMIRGFTSDGTETLELKHMKEQAREIVKSFLPIDTVFPINKKLRSLDIFIAPQLVISSRERIVWPTLLKQNARVCFPNADLQFQMPDRIEGGFKMEYYFDEYDILRVRMQDRFKDFSFFVQYYDGYFE